MIFYQRISKHLLIAGIFIVFSIIGIIKSIFERKIAARERDYELKL
jgi:hypothetical protein